MFRADDAMHCADVSTIETPSSVEGPMGLVGQVRPKPGRRFGTPAADQAANLHARLYALLLSVRGELLIRPRRCLEIHGASSLAQCLELVTSRQELLDC